MKKALVFILVASMVLSMAACSKKGTDKDTANNKSVTNDKGTTEGKGEEKTDKKDTVKAAFLGWRFGDKGFNELTVSGVTRADNDFANLDITAIDITTDPANFVPSLLEACDSGYEVIALAAFEFEEILEEYAPQYPDITFILLDGECDYATYDLPNVYSATFMTNETAFLAGMTASYITSKLELEGINEDKVIGFIGGQDNVPTIWQFYIGFSEGATYYDPDTKVVHAYTNSFDDSAKAKELALAQYNSMNADLVYHAAGSAGLGIFEAAYETGKYAFGCNTDQTKLYEGKNEQDRIITSTMIGVDQAIYNALEAYLNGTLETGEHHTLGIAQGIGGLADNDYFRSYVGEEFIKVLDETTEKIKSGEIKVTRAFDVSADYVNDLEEKMQP